MYKSVSVCNSYGWHTQEWNTTYIIIRMWWNNDILYCLYSMVSFFLPSMVSNFIQFILPSFISYFHLSSHPALDSSSLWWFIPSFKPPYHFYVLLLASLFPSFLPFSVFFSFSVSLHPLSTLFFPPIFYLVIEISINTCNNPFNYSYAFPFFFCPFFQILALLVLGPI